MVSLHGGHAEDDESEKPTVVRIHRKKRYSKYRVLAPSPAFSAPTDFKKQHGVTLGRAPRPCLLPGPQPYTYPRNKHQLPAEPGPGEYEPKRVLGDGENFYEHSPDGYVPQPGKEALEARIRELRKRLLELHESSGAGEGRNPSHKAVMRIEGNQSLRRYQREYAEARLLLRHLRAIESDERADPPSPDSATLKSSGSTLFTTTSMAASRAISRQGSFPLTVTASRFDWMP